MFGGVKCGDLTIVSVVEGVGAVGEGVGSFDDFASGETGYGSGLSEGEFGEDGVDGGGGVEVFGVGVVGICVDGVDLTVESVVLVINAKVKPDRIAAIFT
jgi:hypothetical protein